ncbi:rho GTPase-activating protein 44-like isoform X2 [Branchiostoma floridae]|uniref:Rho GTPase-activating protein 44-like isoform X2 n=1 Tax=Branchiostoma floridae TaxID=7739 RepID=A0A9J7M4W0_BRAFL|nr:rho GTPase-activating protein 44-like isoform X2 [Branchiostoma floridae]
MKKQFLRVKQLANQTVGRAEKTEVLSDELLQIEKKIDNVKLATHNVTKKLSACQQGGGDNLDKRMKKLPQSALSQSMLESSSLMGDETLLGTLFQLCGEGQGNLAKDLTNYEMEVEKTVMTPLTNLQEVDIPAIQTQRKRLAKLVLDMDSARSRYHSAIRSSNTGGNQAAAMAKAESLKDEMDDAQSRMNLCRDALATDMYQFVSKEQEYAHNLISLVEAQIRFHRAAISSLEKVLPAMKGQLEQAMMKPVYGLSLEEHLKITERDIALPLEACALALLEWGMEEEGLFRVAGSSSKTKKLKAALDSGIITGLADLEEYVQDVHSISGALKLYLRELPEPLMTFDLFQDWMEAGSTQDPQVKLQALWSVCDRLPKQNYNNFRYLIKFLATISTNSEVNKMSASNLALVLAPNLIWSREEGGNGMEDAALGVMVTGVASMIVQTIIQHADWFFPGEFDFQPSTPGSAGSTPQGSSTMLSAVGDSAEPVNGSGDHSLLADKLHAAHTESTQHDVTQSEGLLKQGPFGVPTQPSPQVSPYVSPRVSPTLGRKKKQPAPPPPGGTPGRGSPGAAQLQDTSLSPQPDTPVSMELPKTPERRVSGNMSRPSAPPPPKPRDKPNSRHSSNTSLDKVPGPETADAAGDKPPSTPERVPPTPPGKPPRPAPARPEAPPKRPTAEQIKPIVDPPNEESPPPINAPESPPPSMEPLEKPIVAKRPSMERKTDVGTTEKLTPPPVADRPKRTGSTGTKPQPAQRSISCPGSSEDSEEARPRVNSKEEVAAL